MKTQSCTLLMLLARLADKWATGILSLATGARAAIVGGIATDDSGAHVAETLLVPAVSQTLDVAALVVGTVARLMAVGLQAEGIVSAAEDEFFIITHNDKSRWSDVARDYAGALFCRRL